MNKKILLLTNSLRSHINFRAELSIYLNKNYDLTIISKYDLNKNINLKLYSSKFINIELRGNRYLGELICFFKTFFQIFNFNGDLLIAYTLKPILYMLISNIFFKKKNIIFFTGLGSILINKKNFIFKFIKKILFVLIRYNKSTIIVLNSYDYRYFKIYTKNPVHIIESEGINIQQYPSSKILKKITSIGYIGRFISDKGFNLVVKLLEDPLFKNHKFIFIGGMDKNNPSNTFQNLEYLKNKYKNLIIIPWVDDIIKFANDIDLLLLPSKREGASRVLLEFMLMSKLVLASNRPGNNEIIKDQYNGYLCQSNLNSFKNKLISILNDEQNYEKICLNASKSVKKFHDNKVINQKIINIIEENV